MYDKCQQPQPGESWLPPTRIPQNVGEELNPDTLPAPPIPLPSADMFSGWADVERVRQLQFTEHPPRPPQWELWLDRWLLRLAGREPLSTLVMTAAGLVLAAFQEDPTNWRGWLHGAAFALAGRLMNERH